MTAILEGTTGLVFLSIMSFFAASMVVVSYASATQDFFERLWLLTIAIPLALLGGYFALGAIGVFDITKTTTCG